MSRTHEQLLDARAAAARLAALDPDTKNKALLAMAEALKAGSAGILEANAADVEDARGHLSEVMLDRLILTQARIDGMADGIVDVTKLPDPVGIVLEQTQRPNGLSISRVSVPLGVIGIIYESRPNVTSDAAALCFKSGNACVLKSGKEAHRTSAEIVRLLREAVKPFCDENTVNILEDYSREASGELMNSVGLVDAIIPRGGAGLIRACVENARVPCIQTGTGICHIYVDSAADLQMAVGIIENAKTARPSVCNAEEVCLVAEAVAESFLPALCKRLTADRIAAGKHPVELRLDAKAAKIISGTPAGPADFDTEFLDYVLAVKVVKDVREAVAHIGAHSTHHSDAIITSDAEAAEYFLNSVDSAAVYHNASTRFTDGGEFGLGCEIGISTQKLHARGPMGLRELTSYKYIVRGKGQVR